jgi:hypothetical protein
MAIAAASLCSQPAWAASGAPTDPFPAWALIGMTFSFGWVRS